MTTPTAPQPKTDAPWIEIFRAGTHTDASGRKMTFGREHLQEIAGSYDPQLHAAPVVVGHPKTDDPALGWNSELKVEGDSLFARETDVLPEFEDARDAGQYRKRSASFYLPDSPGNPTPGKLYLRHVGWLGAMPPAIKGMADKLKRGAAAFGEDDGEGVIEFQDMAVDFGDGAPRWIVGPIASALSGLREGLIEALGVEKADRILPRYHIDSIRDAGLVPESKSLAYGEGEEEDVTHPNDPNPEEEAAMSQQAQELAAQQEKLAADRAELERQQSEFEERRRAADEAAAQERAKARAEEAAEFADSLVGEGRLLPAMRPALIALYGAAQQIEQPLNFGEGEEAQELSAVEIVRKSYSALPQSFDFGEKSGDGGDAVDTNDPAALAAAAAEFQESERRAGREISISQAVSHIKHRSN